MKCPRFPNSGSRYYCTLLSSLSRGDVFISAAVGLTSNTVTYVFVPDSHIVLFLPRRGTAAFLLHSILQVAGTQYPAAGFNCVLMLSFPSPRQGEACVFINRSLCVNKETSFHAFLFSPVSASCSSPVSASCSIIPYSFPEFLRLDS